MPADAVETQWVILGPVRNRTGYSICRCSCGDYREVLTQTILDGRSKSCGCLTRERRLGGRRITHPIGPGDRFGRLTVVDAQNRKAISCRCDCGTARTVPAPSLYGGLTQSCGCLKSERSRSRGHGNTGPLLPVGARYGMLTVVGGTRREKTECVCDCGNTRTASAANLISGKTHSCGCTRRPWRGGSPSHGMSKHELYPIWQGMRARCLNPKATGYRNYGGRGISIYEPWLDAAVFIADIQRDLGPRPAGTTLDRIDNDKDYVPGNLRWADLADQSRNRRHVVARDVQCPNCQHVFRAETALTYIET